MLAAEELSIVCMAKKTAASAASAGEDGAKQMVVLKWLDAAMTRCSNHARVGELERTYTRGRTESNRPAMDELNRTCRAGELNRTYRAGQTEANQTEQKQIE